MNNKNNESVTRACGNNDNNNGNRNYKIISNNQ